MGGRFGKHGDTKRKARLRRSRRDERAGRPGARDRVTPPRQQRPHPRPAGGAADRAKP